MEFIITGLVTFFGLLFALLLSGASPVLGALAAIATLVVAVRRVINPPL